MALPAPAWRVKTRPCPFYQQGRCLFADGCNFQHTVSARISISTSVPVTAPQTSGADSIQHSPLTVTSPQSVRSPPRSPRLAGLLLALKDVIGEDPNDNSLPPEDEPPYRHPSVSEESTLVNSIDSLFMNADERHSSVGRPGSAPFAPVQIDDDDSSRPSSYHERAAPERQPSINEIRSTPEKGPPFDLLSPVDLSHLNLLSFNQDFYDSAAPERSSTIDSGYAETWKSPSQHPRSPPRSPLKSTFGLLASPYGTPSLRVLSPQLGVFIGRPQHTPASADIQSEMSLDSPNEYIPSYKDDDTAEGSEEYVVVADDGSNSYAVNHHQEYCADQPIEGDHSLTSPWDVRAQPSGSILSAADPVPFPTFSDRGSNSEGEGEEEENKESEPSSFLVSPWDAQGQSVVVEDAPGSPVFPAILPPFRESNDEPGSPQSVRSQGSVYDPDAMINPFASAWEDEENSAAAYLDMPVPSPLEAEHAINRAAATPRRFLEENVEFVDNEPIGCSSLVEPSYDASLEIEAAVESTFPEGVLERDDRADYTPRYDDPVEGEESMFSPLRAHYPEYPPLRSQFDDSSDVEPVQELRYPGDDLERDDDACHSPARFNDSAGDEESEFSQEHTYDSVETEEPNFSVGQADSPGHPTLRSQFDDSLEVEPVEELHYPGDSLQQADDADYSAPLDDSSYADYYEHADSLEQNFPAIEGSSHSPAQADVTSPGAEDTGDWSFEAESLSSGSPEGAANLVNRTEVEDTEQFDNSSMLEPVDDSMVEGSVDGFSRYSGFIGGGKGQGFEQGDEADYTTSFEEPLFEAGSYEGGAVQTEVLGSVFEDDTMDYTTRFGDESYVEDATFNSSEGDTSKYLQQEMDDTSVLPQQDVTSTSEYLQREADIRDEVEEEAEGESRDAATGELAYLSSPVANNENDTLNSIYADYSEVSGGSTESSESLHTVPDDPPREDRDIKGKQPPSAPGSGFIRERVFTPPPGRTRSGTVVPSLDSPASAPSPPVSFGALSREPISTRSSQRSCSAWSPDSSVSSVPGQPQPEEATTSKKVPFGFRLSMVSGRTGHTSLGSSQSTIKPSREPTQPLPLSSQSEPPFSPDALSPPTETFNRGLRPLRLSALLNSKPSSAPPRTPVFSINRYRNSYRASMSYANANVPSSSRNSLSYNPSLSSKRTSTIPEHNENTLISEANSSPLSSVHLSHLANFDEPQTAPSTRPAIWQSYIGEGPDVTQSTIQSHTHRISRFSEPSYVHEEEDEPQDDTNQNQEYTIRRPLPVVPHTAPVSRTASIIRPPMHAFATPRPTLMFAIASDDVKQVRDVLESGDAGPNDAVGPQSALEFTLTNDQLVHKMEIVKTLLAFGADPKVVTASTAGKEQQGTRAELNVAESSQTLSSSSTTSHPTNPLLESLDPATKYYVERADASHTRRTSALIHRSFFRPLTRVRYELIGQDRALEQLFKVLSIHSRQLAVTPIVVLLCGPSGHGKSLLARKFGALLDVPTHTVNMTALNSTQDLWQSYSMSPYETPTTCTLAEFLINNEGKRCVVVLDEIEKTHDEKTLWSLLMPWELGRCTFEANGRPVDVRNVVWIGTSNVGHDLVFEHHEARSRPEDLVSKEEYADLMGLLRPRVSQRLGASILSRVTTVLPFVPFTLDERRAICGEALNTIAGDIVSTLPLEVVDRMIKGALEGYIAAEGARSLYRAVSNQLVENI